MPSTVYVRITSSALGRSGITTLGAAGVRR